jgi:O-antigen/teichoic acid export membrane protein
MSQDVIDSPALEVESGIPLADPGLQLEQPRFSALAGRIKALAKKRIIWVMGDQGIVSVGNFVTFNLLARSLPPAQYGAFGVVLETILFLNSLQSALVVYPMTVKGATGGAQRLQKIVVGALIFTILLLPILGGLAGGATVTSNAWPVAFCAVFALLMWQVQETTRRALMADLRFSSMLWGDSISYLGQAVTVFLLARAGGLTVGTAFIAMGVTSLAAAAIQAIQLKVRVPAVAEIKTQAGEFWQLGRWMLLANLGGVVTGMGYMWTLRFSHGLEAVAAFTALFAVTKPVNPVASSLCGIITPAVARASASDGPKASIRIAMKYALVGCAILLPPFTLVFLVPTLTLKLLYGAHSHYVSNGNLLRMALFDYASMYVNVILNAWLSGLGESRASCFAQGFTVAATALIALPLTAAFGVAGLVWGSLVAVSCGAAAALFFLMRALKKPAGMLAVG